jgi:cytidylate kinase
MQQDFAKNHQKIVTEGRDQGTVVFPNANYKFFLTADTWERTKRRAEELSQKGLKVNMTELHSEIENRDTSDKSRDVGPLTAAKDAVIIDNTNLTPEQTLNEIIKVINKKN